MRNRKNKGVRGTKNVRNSVGNKGILSNRSTGNKGHTKLSPKAEANLRKVIHTESKINGCLTNAVDRGYLPISLDAPDKEPKTLKTENRELYNILVTKK